MRRLPQILGIVIGLNCAAIVLSSISGRQLAPRNGAMMSECDGALREIVIQYVRGAENVVPVYRQFLPMLRADVTVNVVCPDAEAFQELQTSLPPLPCTLHPIFVKHPMTAWSRDRWVALLPRFKGDPTTLLAPRGENNADTWPARAGDERIAFDIAHALSSTVTAHRSGLEFDGGDLLCEGENVFVTSSVLRRNLNRAVATRDELLRTLDAELHRHVILMDNSPDHHAGMFMMAAGERTMVIADPKQARDLIASDSEIVRTLPGGPDFTEETQRKLDAIAQQCRDLGYHVVRIPTLPAMDRKTYLTYVNVLSEVREGRRIIYMPVYCGAEALNDAAEKAWREIGYDVKRVDCTTTYQCFGNLHCLVNVLDRGSAVH